MRKFEVVSDYKDKGINLPERKTKHSAGYDIEAAEEVYIYPKHMVTINTGVKASMEEDEFLACYIRSSLAMKRGLLLVNSVGIIDSDYYNNQDNEGHIMLGFYNYSNQPVTIKKGERIAQGVFTKFGKVEEDNVETERIGGTGSTDKPVKKAPIKNGKKSVKV